VFLSLFGDVSLSLSVCGVSLSMCLCVICMHGLVWCGVCVYDMCGHCVVWYGIVCCICT